MSQDNSSNEDRIDNLMEAEDTSDYMDDLMSSLMEEPKAPTVVIEPQIEEVIEAVVEVITEDLVVEDTPVASVPYSEPTPKKKRRRPLFESMGIDVPAVSVEDDRDDNVSLADKEPEPEVKVERVEVVEDRSHEVVEDVKVEPLVETVVDEYVEVSQVDVVGEYTNTEEDDMFEDMLSGLIVDEPVKVQAEPKAPTSTATVPLYKKGMDDIKVTADGRTLADMLPGMRSGRKSVVQVVADMKDPSKDTEVNGQMFTDDRYTKHVKVIEDKKSEQDERRALSKKFLQRNAEFSTEERIIMENLGVSNDGFANLMKSTELTSVQKEEVLGLGRYGAERHFKGRRYRTTVGDTAILEFLVIFKFANTRILRWLSNEPQGRTWRKLNRLRDNGLVESQSLIGIPDLWAATTSGVAISGYTYDPGLRPMPKMTTVSSSMGINYIAACLWFNKVNVLNLDDFPAKNRIIALQDDGRDSVIGEELVSELQIRSSLGKEITPSSTTMRALGDERLYDVIASNVREEIDEWVRGGRVDEGPETRIGNEYMWILYPASQLTLSYHVPDLVVVRPRNADGSPNSIAVEMERYEKGNAHYDKIMLAYKLNTHLYKEVVWITPNARVARALAKAAQNVGFEGFRILPIITETGTYNKEDIWMI